MGYGRPSHQNEMCGLEGWLSSQSPGCSSQGPQFDSWPSNCCSLSLEDLSVSPGFLQTPAHTRGRHRQESTENSRVGYSQVAQWLTAFAV